jgi:uncharacterized membrane protein YgcG
MLILTDSPTILLNVVYIFCNFVKTLKSSNLRLNLLKAFAMKRLYPYVIAVTLLISFSSCSVYRNSPTPDDVYYSPGRPVTSAATTENNNSDYYSTPNDNYVRMRVQNPEKWSYFDDYNYDYYGSAYSPYSYSPGVSLSIGFGTGFYSPYYGGFGYYSPMSYYNSYYAWNNCYNPYYGGVVIVNGKNNTSPSYTRMSNFNPSAYQGKYYNSRPSGLSNTGSARSAQNYYNTDANSNYNRSSNNRPVYNNNTNTSPMRSSPSNFSGGGGSSGSGGGGSFSRPHR